MASDFAFPLQDPSAAAERTGRARSVSADLEAIFGEPAPAAGRLPGAARVERGPRTAPPGAIRGRLPAASLGAIGAAALIGLAAGALLVKPPRPPGASHAGALPVEMVAPVQTPQASDAALAAPVATPAPMRPAPPQAASQAPASHGSFAGPQAADRRLRAAYAHAIRAGVPRALLAEDRDRWASARRRYAHDPARLEAAYNVLARDLDRSAAGPTYQRPVRQARPDSLFRFLPGWR
ncbi:MAG: hypothetical protein E7812_13435 [Phenylobacterium sp.]|nr:MAG: hypothetical protein E7812_13435 [Phenylobacterium sp.]